MRLALARMTMIFTFLALTACTEPKEYQPIVKSVITVVPTSPNDDVLRTLSGVLQPVDQSVLSFEIQGVIETVDVNLGDRFAKGKVLASIEDKVFKLAVQQRKGELSEVNARLTEARLDYERKAQLVSSGAISKAEVDIAESRYESIKDQLDVAQTQIAIAEEDLADTKLVAPYAGSVAQRHIEPSQQVSPSTTIFTIQGSDALEVAVLVPESMISQIAPGDNVIIDVLIDQRRSRIQGTVFERGNQAQRANAFPVTVAINNPMSVSELQSGMSAEVTFSMQKSDLTEGTLIVPLAAVAADADNSHYVFSLVKSDDGRFLTKKVSVSVTSMNTKHAFFIPSEKVSLLVANGLDFLREGQTVLLHDGAPRTINE